MTSKKQRTIFDTVKRDWKARKRPGGIYCSPACGRGCTKDEHERATEAAEALAKRLGSGWKPNVWENLRWHWSVISPGGVWEVHGTSGTGFDVYVRTGSMFVGRGKTVRAAVTDIRASMLKDVKEKQRLLADDPFGTITMRRCPCPG